MAGNAVHGHLDELHEDGERQRDGKAHYPHDHDEQYAHGELHARLERIDDDKVAIDGDHQRRERVHVRRYGQRVGDEMTQDSAEWPVINTHLKTNRNFWKN